MMFLNSLLYFRGINPKKLAVEDLHLAPRFLTYYERQVRDIFVVSFGRKIRGVL